MSSVYSRATPPSKCRVSNHYPLCTSQLPKEPNAIGNRVPEGAELASLRTMAADKQRVVELTEEAQVAREADEELKHRYEVQIPGPLSIQSELHIAKDLAGSLERTASSADPEVQQLPGLPHPLLRCPDDVLRLVFEEFLRGKKSSAFHAATTLSHVCQRWRAIAISSPRLWSWCGLRFGHSDKAIDLRVQKFLSRVKEVPATITLDFDGEGATTLDENMVKIRAMGEVLRAPHVSDLDILIFYPFKPSSVLEALSSFPRHRITDLNMAASNQHDTQGSWNGFLSRFGSIRNLRIDGGAFALGSIKNLQSTFVNICSLTLHYVYRLPLSALLRMTPNLQRLELKSSNVNPEDGANRILLPNIISLHSRGVQIPWETMDCPLIASIVLSYISEPARAGLWAFLQSARMLTELRSNLSPSQLSNLARISPQIQDLYIEVNDDNESVVSVLVKWRQFGLDGPAFPNLRRLSLHLLIPEDTTLKEALSSLIQTRCLSEAHSGATMEGVIALDAFAIITRPGAAFWNPKHHFTKYFPQPAKLDADGHLVYRFARPHGQ